MDQVRQDGPRGGRAGDRHSRSVNVLRVEVMEIVKRSNMKNKKEMV